MFPKTHTAGREPGCKCPAFPWVGDEAFFTLYSVCTSPIFYALPRTCELPSNSLFFSSFLQGREAVSDPSAIAPKKNLFVHCSCLLTHYGSCLFAIFQHCSDLEPSGLLPEVHAAVDLSILKHTPLHLIPASHIPTSHHFVQSGFLSNSTLLFSCSEPLPRYWEDFPFCSGWLRSPSRARHSGYCLSFTFVFLPRLLPQHLKLLKILPGQLYRYTVFGLQNCPVLWATLPW